MLKIIKTKKELLVSIRIPLIHKYKGGGIALFRKNKNGISVFLGKRKNFPYAGKWSFPGGGNEIGESLSQTALREWKEETGTKIFKKFVLRVGAFKIKLPFFEWKTLVIESTQNFRMNRRFISKEFYSYKWVPLDDLSNYKLHPFVMKAVNFYLSMDKMKSYSDKKIIMPRTMDFNMRLFKVDKDGTKYYEPLYTRR